MVDTEASVVPGTTEEKENHRTLRLPLPEDFDSLPPIVQRLMVADRLQGETRFNEIDALVRTGISYEEAKNRIDPKYRGVPFEKVYKRALGKPTYCTFGAGQVGDFDGLFEPFTTKVALYLSALGISNSNGGGPGIMEMTARCAERANVKVAQVGCVRDSYPENYRVLLHIGREAPNPHALAENSVWPIDNLDVRTPMIVNIGRPLAALFYPGGFGTYEELFRLLCSNQLSGNIRTMLPRKIPIILLDFKMKKSRRQNGNGGEFWGAGLYNLAKAMKDYSTIRSSHLNDVHRINVGQASAAREVVNLVDTSAKEVLGYSLIEQWESRNNSKLDEFVASLMQ